MQNTVFLMCVKDVKSNEVMKNWTRHWLRAGGSVTVLKTRIAKALDAAEMALTIKMPAPSLDILLTRSDPRGVIPELGIGGWALGPTLVQMSFDLESEHLDPALDDGAVQRIIIHEANHCLRMSNRSDVQTLGAALVREGLAGRFVEFILGAGPEPWEIAIPEGELASYMPCRAVLDQHGYDHNA